jgi:tetratricopeptide (TPR) repeat protein
LALFQQLGDDRGCAILLHRLAITAQREGDLDRARKLVEASQAMHEKNEDWWSRTFGLAQTTGTLGAIARDSGDEQRGYELITDSARMAREVGLRWWESGALAELACLALNAGRIDEAEALARESLRLAKELHDRAGRVFGVGLLARIAAERGQSERAGRLWGSIEDEDVAAPLGGWRRHRQECEARIREAAGDEFERGRAEGCALTLDDAVSLALESSDA